MSVSMTGSSRSCRRERHFDSMSNQSRLKEGYSVARPDFLSLTTFLALLCNKYFSWKFRDRLTSSLFLGLAASNLSFGCCELGLLMFDPVLLPLVPVGES